MTKRRDLTALTRVSLAAAVGIVVGVLTALKVPWQVATLSGWNAAAAVFCVWVWVTVRHKDAPTTQRIATIEDDSRSSAEVILVAASLASLVGVGLNLLKASQYTGTERALITSVAVATVALSWLVVQCVYTLRYAHVFYVEGGGIDYHDGRAPDYGDFAYVAFTLGMTYQVSDTDITSKRIRMIALRQGLLSYVLGIAVVAMTINVVAGLLGR
jgi:uncharacterized membrane protein